MPTRCVFQNGSVSTKSVPSRIVSAFKRMSKSLRTGWKRYVTKEFEIALIAITVWGEARGESYEGKLAVANVICNRMRRQKVGASRVVLKAWQFSFWNTEDPSRDRISEINPEGDVWQECLRAAAAAYLGLEADPTGGAEFYMNVDTVRKSRGGTLPKWWDIDTTSEGEVVIDRHTFRRRKA